MSQMDGHLKRIERIGGQMRIAVWILMLATPVGFVATIYWDGFVPLLPVPHEIAVEVAGLSVGGVLAVVVLAALKPTTFLLALWFLQDLFGLYRRGLIFEAQNVQRLRHLGWALIGIDLAEFLQRLSVGPLLSFLDAAEPFLTVGIGLSLSIVGVFAIVIAKIMDLGRELKEFEELAI